MKIFQHHDLELKYKVQGSVGSVYVLLHGFGGGPQDWSQIADVLARNNRVVMPNLKSFFSHSEPLTFTRQVEILAAFIHSIYDRKGVQVLNLMGQSYGATLSLGLRLTGNFKIDTHTLLNPMPFKPFEYVRDFNVKVLMGLGFVPGGVNFYLNTSRGRRSLEELAKIFRIGALSSHEVRHFNERKLTLIVKAFERFNWIDKNEKWSEWQEKLKKLPEGAITRLVYSSGDSIYGPEDYKKIAALVKAKSVFEVEHKGHLLIQDVRPEFIFAS